MGKSMSEEDFEKITKAGEESELLRRAMVAFFKSGQTELPEYSSSVEVVDKLRYVVLRNRIGVLAVYRIRNDGMLKIMRRPPACIALTAPTRGNQGI